MQSVRAYALAAMLAAAAAYFIGSEAPPAVQWLMLAGAVLFALAALGRYYKETRGKR